MTTQSTPQPPTNTGQLSPAAQSGAMPPASYQYEDDISLWDIWFFLTSHAKLLVLCGLAGLLVALTGFYTLARPYTATLILTNDANLDFEFFKRLRINLPRVSAVQQIKSKYTEDLLSMLSSEDWWNENLQPTLSISKADQKEFGWKIEDPKDLKIINFKLSIKSDTSKKAQFEINQVADFFKDASSLFMVKDLTQRYNFEYDVNKPVLQKNRTDLLKSIRELKLRLDELEKIKKRYPDSIKLPYFLSANPENATDKNLPIGSQIIAVNIEIADKQFELKKIADSLDLINLKNDYADRLEKLIPKHVSGVELLTELQKPLNVKLSELSAKESENLAELQRYQTISKDFADVASKFTPGLGQRTSVVVTKKSSAIYAALGALAGLFLGLLAALVRQAIQNRQQERTAT